MKAYQVKPSSEVYLAGEWLTVDTIEKIIGNDEPRVKLEFTDGSKFTCGYETDLGFVR